MATVTFSILGVGLGTASALAGPGGEDPATNGTAEEGVRWLWPIAPLIDKLEIYDEGYREIEQAQLETIRSATAETWPPLVLARDMASGVYQLRAGRLNDEAERVRDRVLPLLAEHPDAPGGVAPRDLFDTLSAPELPALVPWGAGPGLP